MNRKEFLSLVGVSAGALILSSCLGSCKKSSSNSKLTKDFTLDLTSSANSTLTKSGGYVVSNGVIIANRSGNYIAVAAACTHEGSTISYEINNSRFHCPNHGANFNESGSVINGPATFALQQFNTQLNGTTLRIYS